MTDAACPLSMEERKRLTREVLREELELIGLRVESPEAREDTRKDFAFVRAWRERLDGAANKVGYVVLTVLVTGVLALIAIGAQIKFGAK